MSTGLRPAVFLDRDGTLLVEGHYLDDPDGVVLVPGALDALRSLRRAGYALVVVTNQSGIARGLYTLNDYHAVAARLDAILAEAGVPVDATLYCPHHPDEAPPCGCRKPATGMHLRAAGDLGLDPETSWYVGDKVTDVLPALELRGRGVLVRTGHGRGQERWAPPGVVVVDDLAAAAALVVASGSRGRIAPARPGMGSRSR